MKKLFLSVLFISSFIIQAAEAQTIDSQLMRQLHSEGGFYSQLFQFYGNYDAPPNPRKNLTTREFYLQEARRLKAQHKYVPYGPSMPR